MWVKSIPPKLMRDKFGLYQHDTWHGEMDRCWIDNDRDLCVTSRIIRTRFGNVEHVAITRGQGTFDGSGDISWSEKMRIKNELFGENRFAIEVFPKQKNLIDVMDVYHLWVFDKKLEMPFGIAPKECSHAVNRGYQFTEEDMRKMAEDYRRTGKI